MKSVLSKKSLHAVYGTAAFLLGSVMLLWSWNTLSMLFDGPVAQYKHAVAALAVAFVLGSVLRIAAYRGQRSHLDGPDDGARSVAGKKAA